jgi:ADP-ribose pyrophosphatase
LPTGRQAGQAGFRGNDNVFMKLNPKAKKVFTGDIFDTYQWQQEQFDGTFKTFEMLKRPGTIQVIAVKGDKIVATQEEQPTIKRAFGLLGGRQEPGEDSLVSAKRELLEESGLVSDDWELLKTFEPLSKIDWVIHYFIARDCRKVTDQNLDGGEKITLQELNFDEFIDKILGDDYWGGEFALYVAKLKIRNQLDQLRTLIFPNR